MMFVGVMDGFGTSPPPTIITLSDCRTFVGLSDIINVGGVKTSFLL